MRTIEDVQREASRKYPEGCAIVDLKYNEVFRFNRHCDAQVIMEWPSKFRIATEEEAEILGKSGKSYVSLF